MKKYILAFFSLIIIFIPLSFISAASTWSYSTKIVSNDIVTGSKDYKSPKDCNNAITAFKNDPNYKSNPKEFIVGTCVEDKGPVDINAKKDTSEGNKVYNLLAPIGGFNVAPTNIGDYFNKIIKIAIGLCGTLAVIMIVLGGIQYMGDESVFGKTEAKSKITAAILGLLIALGSYALLNTVNPTLLGGNIKIGSVSAVISSEDTSTGSSTSLCLSKTNPPDPNLATGTKITLNSTITNEYIKARDKISGLSTGIKYLITAQTAVEGFTPTSKSYKTNNPGNISNVDNAVTPYGCNPETKGTHCFKSLGEGISAQHDTIKNVASGSAKSYIIGGKYTCALGDNEVYNGYLYQFLRIYATGARTNNNYLNAIIGYFKANGKNITAKTTINEIYNMK